MIYSIRIQWDWAFTECRWCELRKYKFKWTYDCRSDNCNLRNCKLTRKKIAGVQRDSSAAVPYQLSYEDPYIGSCGHICWVHLNWPIGLTHCDDHIFVWICISSVHIIFILLHSFHELRCRYDTQQPRHQGVFPGFGEAKAWEKRPGDEVGHSTETYRQIRKI